MNKELETTANSRIYRRRRKQYLEGRGIHCSYCKYHQNENYTGNHYGGYIWKKNKSSIKYPSWKLTSKNKKQWMDKKIIKKIKKYNQDIWITFEFKKNNGYCSY